MAKQLFIVIAACVVLALGCGDNADRQRRADCLDGTWSESGEAPCAVLRVCASGEY